jgi:hypothetical protein
MMLSKILGVPQVEFRVDNWGTRTKKEQYVFSWEEIFCEIGKLQERATNFRRDREF